MCNPASFIVTGNDVFWCETDSHEDIIKKYDLNDRTETPDFVRVEITPPYNNYQLPVENWMYRTDQDFLPEWYNPQEAENACRKELKNWYKEKVIIGVDGILLASTISIKRGRPKVTFCSLTPA